MTHLLSFVSFCSLVHVYQYSRFKNQNALSTQKFYHGIRKCGSIVKFSPSKNLGYTVLLQALLNNADIYTSTLILCSQTSYFGSSTPVLSFLSYVAKTAGISVAQHYVNS